MYEQNQQPVNTGIPTVKWSGLTKGNKLPINRAIGTMQRFYYDTQSQYGLRVVFVMGDPGWQILASDAPWTERSMEISIKYSEKENSAWGEFVGSAKSLHLAEQAMTMEAAAGDLMGKCFEVEQVEKDYGEQKEGDQKGTTMKGSVWHLLRIVPLAANPVNTQQFVPPGFPAPQATVTSWPVSPDGRWKLNPSSNQWEPNNPIPPPAPAAPPVPVAPPVPQMPPIPPAPPMAPPVPVAPMAPPIPPAIPGTFDSSLKPDDTPHIRAKKLLHGQTVNGFMGLALIDPIVKSDQQLVNAIFSQSWFIGLKSSNPTQVSQDAQSGKYTVLA
jgi:hypothetical protein